MHCSEGDKVSAGLLEPAHVAFGGELAGVKGQVSGLCQLAPWCTRLLYTKILFFCWFFFYFSWFSGQNLSKFLAFETEEEPLERIRVCSFSFIQPRPAPVLLCLTFSLNVFTEAAKPEAGTFSLWLNNSPSRLRLGWSTSHEISVSFYFCFILFFFLNGC